jgi:peptidoglycan/LPS O-acetylase OafA/YrhL
MNPKGRNGAIDFLRFAASVILVLHHYQQVFNVFIDNGINFYSGRFYWGHLVDLFFVISGFFLVSAVTKISDGQLKFKEYYLHRCVRLLPLVGVTAIIYFVVNNYVYFKIMGEYYKARSTGSELILSILGMQVGWANLEGSHLNPPMWYISALLIAFVVIYLLASVSGKIKKSYVYLVIVLILLSMAGDLFGLNLPFFQTDARRAYVDVSMGLLLATLLKKHKIKGIGYLVTIPLLAAGAALYILALDAQRPVFQQYALVFLFFPAIMILCTSDFAQKLFSAKIWNVLGGASFDTYVLHCLILILIRCADKYWGFGLNFANWWLEYLICVVIFGIGLLSYKFVEPNLRKLAGKAVSYI